MKKGLVIISLSLFLGSCDNLLPLPSSNGKNTFGCKVEGTTMKASTQILRDNPISAQMTDSTFYISGSDYNDKLYVSISLGNIRKKGVYQLDNINSGASYQNRGYYPEADYETYNKYGGKVYITKFDTKNRIVSGTFSFKAVKVNRYVFPNKYDTTDVVEVTRGRFDVVLKN